MIVEENVEYLHKHYPEMLNLSINDLRAGAHMLAVRLSDGSIGIASSDTGSNIHCTKEQRDFGDFTPLQIRGRTLDALFSTCKSSPLINTLRIASLNAVSGSINKRNGTRILRNVELIDLIDQDKSRKVVMVGAFHSYIKEIAESGWPISVLELDASAMLPEQLKYFKPAHQFPEVLKDAGIVIITGLTTVNNTFDDLIKACPPDAQITLIGPSSNLIADVLFRKNIKIIGSTLITKPELVFDLVGQGAAGYHLFRYCAEKVFILNEK